MPNKLTYNHVKSYIDSQGYKLLSKDYKNAHDKLLLQCPAGHEFKTKYNNFKNGKRCPYCYGNKKLTYEEVKSYIEDQGYQLLSKKYENANDKLLLQCNNEHQFEMSYASFKRDNRCPYCYGNKKYTYEKVKSYIESQGYKLLSQKYKNNRVNLLLQCPIGHEFEMRFNDFKNHGQRCPVCYKENYYKSITDVELFIKNKKYKLLSTKYANAYTKLSIQCPAGHKFEMSYSHFYQGQRCPVCWSISLSSNPEKEIQKFITNIYNGEIINNDRNTIVNPYTGRNLELDIYLPDLNKAIEFNGTYWHSLPYVQQKDKIKIDQCKALGIGLIIIQEQTYKLNKNHCLDIIQNFINN